MAKMQKLIVDPEVQAVFDSYPESIKPKLLFLRQLILETASSIEEIKALEETLKWGEPSYLTLKPKIGSTIRIAWKESKYDHYSILFKCTANLVPAFKERFSGDFNFGGDRSIDFKKTDEVPAQKLKQCIALALTYHRNKKLNPSERWEMIERIT